MLVICMLREDEYFDINFRLMDKGYWNIVYVHKRGYSIVKDALHKLTKNSKRKEIFYYYNKKKTIRTIDTI